MRRLIHTKGAIVCWALLALTILAAENAHAEPVPWVTEATPQGVVPFDADAELAYALALDYWQVEAPPNCTSLERFLAPLVVKDGREVAGLASLATQPESECALIVKADLGFYGTCVAMAHEVGHLLGLDHNEDPASVMQATSLATPQCIREWNSRMQVVVFPASGKRRCHAVGHRKARVGCRQRVRLS